jgi:hypothetical protein
VVITELGLQSQLMKPDVAAAMIGAAMLAVLLFPTIPGALYGPNRRATAERNTCLTQSITGAERPGRNRKLLILLAPPTAPLRPARN